MPYLHELHIVRPVVQEVPDIRPWRMLFGDSLVPIGRGGRKGRWVFVVYASRPKPFCTECLLLCIGGRLEGSTPYFRIKSGSGYAERCEAIAHELRSMAAVVSA